MPELVDELNYQKIRTKIKQCSKENYQNFWDPEIDADTLSNINHNMISIEDLYNNEETNEINKNKIYNIDDEEIEEENNITINAEEILTSGSENEEEKDIKNNKNELEKIKNNKNNFNKDFDEFIELFKIKKNEFIKKWENFIQIQNDIIDKVNNKKTLNYENICNLNEVTMIKEKNNFYNDFLKKEKNFNKKGKYLLNLLSK